MKRSEINAAFRRAKACFEKYSWALPPQPRWDITDFGLGDFERYGLVLINLAAEPEYCEKLMYAWAGQTTPCHVHAKKKEDIICRMGRLTLWLWDERPQSVAAGAGGSSLLAAIDGTKQSLASGQPITLDAGQRITLEPGLWHAFAPASEECILGEVSTANDDVGDNFFLDPRVGRFSEIEEDEAAAVRLLNE